jgi:hypothetical protein
MKEPQARYLFLFSVAFLAYLTGVLTGAFQLPPYKLVSSSIRDVVGFAIHWKNDLGIEPTRHLYWGQKSRTEWNAAEPDRMSHGLRLIASVTPGRAALYGVRLFDSKGSELHYWPVHYERLDPDGRSPNNIFLHGFSVFEDGAVVVNFDRGGTLAKIDACGDTLWKLGGRFHHLVNRSYDGTIWAWNAYFLVQIDPAEGAILRRISLIEDIIEANDQMGIFGMLRNDELKPSQFHSDPFHPNDIEILAPEMADAFPQFEAGDIMISLRTPNLVAVLDPQTLKVKWWRHGPWHRQHDPDFQPDGTITVFDNRLDLGPSQIVKIDPLSNETLTLFRGSEEIPFYTRMRGQHQVLENGNLLLTPANSGRTLEVTADGQLVWEFQNVFDERRNGVVSMAILVAEDFFSPDALTCPSPVSSALEN